MKIWLMSSPKGRQCPHLLTSWEHLLHRISEVSICLCTTSQAKHLSLRGKFHFHAWVSQEKNLNLSRGLEDQLICLLNKNLSLLSASKPYQFVLFRRENYPRELQDRYIRFPFQYRWILHLKFICIFPMSVERRGKRCVCHIFNHKISLIMKIINESKRQQMRARHT